MNAFAFRPVVPEDRPALRAIAAKTWEGSDYLQQVLDEWIADRDGVFLAATLGGRVVGCGKITFLTPVDAWLEGLRKDPEVSEPGMAAALAVHALRVVAARPTIASLRFATYVGNVASRKANERIGFRLRDAFSWKSWDRTGEELAALPRAVTPRVVPVRDASRARPLVEGSGWFAAARGLCPEGWRVYQQDHQHPATGLDLVFIDAVDEEVAGLLLDALVARATGAERRQAAIDCMVPPGMAKAKSWLAGRGFASWEQEDDFLVYELSPEVLGRYRAGGE